MTALEWLFLLVGSYCAGYLIGYDRGAHNTRVEQLRKRVVPFERKGGITP